MARSVTSWLSIPEMSTDWSRVASTLQSAPANPPLAPRSTREDTLERVAFETTYSSLLIMRLKRCPLTVMTSPSSSLAPSWVLTALDWRDLLTDSADRMSAGSLVVGCSVDANASIPSADTRCDCVCGSSSVDGTIHSPSRSLVPCSWNFTTRFRYLPRCSTRSLWSLYCSCCSGVS